MAAYTTTSETSVTHLGHTWNFTASRPVWWDPNGYPNVQRPVAIASYTPAPYVEGDGKARNGAMINPVPGTAANPADCFHQGFTEDVVDGTYDYDPSLNYGLTPNYLVPKPGVLCNVTYDNTRWLPEGTHFRSMSMLACWDAVPEVGTYSPPFAGDGLKSPGWKESDLDPTKLRNKPIPSPLPANWPTFETLIAALSRRQFDFIPYASTGGSLKAADNSNYPNFVYGEDIAAFMGNASILLNHAYTWAEKLPLLRLVVMHGLDTYGLLVAGANWQPLGGFNVGRKIAMMITAAVLNDQDIKDALDGALAIFNEDKTHFIVDETHRTTTKVNIEYAASGVEGPENPRYGDPVRFMTYSIGQVGMGDWSQEYYNPAYTTPQMEADSISGGGVGDPAWNYLGYRGIALYRKINAGADLAFCYAAQLMGMRAVVNNEAEFDYIFNRVVPVYLPSFGEPYTFLWARDMAGIEDVTTPFGSGIYESGQVIIPACETPEVTIRGTVDGSVPTVESTDMTAGYTVTTGLTLRLKAFGTLPPSGTTDVVIQVISDGTPAPPRVTILTE